MINTNSATTYTTGLTDVLAYGSYRGSVSAMWQANEHIKFQFGAGYAHDQGHVITGDSPCNPNADSTVQTAGPCHTTNYNPNGTVANETSTGLPNPNYRAVINDVGRRFWVDSSNTWDVFGSAVVMF